MDQTKRSLPHRIRQNTKDVSAAPKALHAYPRVSRLSLAFFRSKIATGVRIVDFAGSEVSDSVSDNLGKVQPELSPLAKGRELSQAQPKMRKIVGNVYVISLLDCATMVSTHMLVRECPNDFFECPPSSTNLAPRWRALARGGSKCEKGIREGDALVVGWRSCARPGSARTRCSARKATTASSVHPAWAASHSVEGAALGGSVTFSETKKGISQGSLGFGFRVASDTNALQRSDEDRLNTPRMAGWPATKGGASIVRRFAGREGHADKHRVSPRVSVTFDVAPA